MRVLYIIDSFSSGGKERRLLELLKSFKASSNNINIKVIIFDENIYYEGIKDLDLELIIISRKKHNGLKVFQKVKKVIKSFNPDIIHSWGSIPSFYIALAKIFYKFKFLNAMVASAPENMKYTKTWFIAKFSFLFSDIVLSNSQAGLIAFDAPKAKSHYIHNGFNFNRIKYITDSEIIKKELLITTEYIIGMVATFSDKKDYDTYLEAANNICKERKDVTFLCVGSGRNLLFFREKYKDNKNILFTGNRKDIESIVNIFDIGVLCTYGESFSNSILEYMALGKPVVATDKGGNKEIVENNISGYLFEHKNIGDFSKKLKNLLNNKELRMNMGQRSKKIIEEKFSIKQMSENTYKIYKELLQ